MKSTYRAVWLGFLVGCQAEPEAQGESLTWHGQIKPLVERSCAGCHTEGSVAPFTLETYDDVVAWLPLVVESVRDRTMPPWLAEPDCNNYVGDFSLSDEERDSILAWADAEAPLGEPGGEAGSEMPEGDSLPRVDRVLEMPVSYRPSSSAEEANDYRCFILEWDEPEATYVEGYRIVPGNLDLVHHVIVYTAPAETADAFAAMDAKDPDPGYPCFGGPGVIRQEDANWLGGWAPGAVAGPFPDGLGLLVQPGTVLIMQVHYYDDGEGGEDQSAVELMLADEVAEVGWVQPFADPDWLYGGEMILPAQTQAVEHGYDMGFPANLQFHTAALHMHTLGQTARLSIQHADGSETCLLDIDRWDFNWQRAYQFVEAQSITGGDQLSLRCSWDNPTDLDIDWGDGTDDEMCLGIMLMSFE